MTVLAFGGAVVLLALGLLSAFTATAVRWPPDAPGRKGAIARRLTGADGSSPATLWWAAGELLLMSVGCVFVGLGAMPRYADAIWPSVVALVFLAVGSAAGVALVLRRRARAR
ncbi:hypothetical protein [Cryptosporangium japonicum]|uniref:SdpI/YhfL family protein n=1 Tax=Cryptosporangium japonicum TaxID=80872 RepID=A0ABN0TY23_9ACTN